MSETQFRVVPTNDGLFEVRCSSCTQELVTVPLTRIELGELQYELLKFVQYRDNYAGLHRPNRSGPAPTAGKASECENGHRFCEGGCYA